MVNVKDIRVERIDATSARAFVARHHYSGKVVNNSQLHFGAFHGGKLHGVMSFGPPMDKSKVLPLVAGTGWNEMIELNRMAFGPALPRNSESRCIAVALRLLRKHCPQVKWVLSFADGTQCGDGTIYRASGFLLTSIKENTSLLRLADGQVVANITFSKGSHILKTGGGAKRPEGSEKLVGFQLRYIYLLDKTARLTVPVLPYSRIDEMGAGMYKGQNVPISQRKPAAAIEPGAVSLNLQVIPAPEAQTDERPESIGEAGGSIPTPALTCLPPANPQPRPS